MYMLLDKEQMAILCCHQNRNTLMHLERIEFAHTSTCTFKNDSPESLDHLTTVELLRLYTSLTKRVFPGFDREKMMALIHPLLTRIAPVQVDAMRVIAQSVCIPDSDRGYYKYDPLSIKPIARKEAVVHAPLLPGETVIVAPIATTRSYVPVVAKQQTVGENKYPPPWS